MRRRWIVLITSPIWMTVALGTIIAAQVLRLDGKASQGKRPQ